MLSQKLVHQPYGVDEIRTHFDTHEDELNAYEQVKMGGDHLFPGADRAKIVLVDAGLHRDAGHDGDHLLRYGNTLCIGACGGRFDEHDPKYGDTTKESAASRMASWLGLEDDPGLKRILAFSKRSDTSSGTAPFEVPNLVKSWWGAKLELADVLSLYHTIFRAMYEHHSGTRVAELVPGEFKRLIIQWYIETFAAPDKLAALAGRFKTAYEAAKAFKVVEETQQIIWFFDRNEKKIGAKSDFDLESVLENMVCTGVSKEERQRVAFTSLHTKHVEQQRWLAARREFRAAGRYLDSKLTPYLVAVIESDNNQMRRAVAKEDPDVDILIQRNSDGHTKVFDINKRFDMSPIAARLRMAEWKAMGNNDRLSLSVLLSEGTLPQIPQWFNWTKGHYVMNGTDTAPNTPVTHNKMGTGPNAIPVCVAEGLDYARRRKDVLPMAKVRPLIERRREERRQAKAAAVSPVD